MKIEALPKWLLCVPLVAQWFWLAARHRSLTLPSVLNPCIETGGLAGESKLACLARIPPEHAPWVARTFRAPADPAALGYPLIAKPDIGWCGYGVRRIDDAAGLASYAAAFPPGADWLMQEWIAGPLEAGLFYVRPHGAATGRLTAIALRAPPTVVGDGRRSTEELIGADPRLRHRRFAGPLARVPRAGEPVPLATVASLRVGGLYTDGARLRSPALEARVDAIARAMDGFHFGRFDVRAVDAAGLSRGEFRIIEVNGAGSEAIECWDPALDLWSAFRGVFAKQRLLFATAAGFREAGARPVGVVALSRAWLMQQSLISRYPASN